MKNNYNTDSIKKMEGIEHIRARHGMYIGSSDYATSLLLECIDNAIDEVGGGYANQIAVIINNKDGEYVVADNGRGIPADEKLPLEEDPPILICNNLFTSGKFDKGENKSYNISAGLNGVGLTAVNALSEQMFIDIFKKGKHHSYTFKHDEEPKRNPVKKVENDKIKFSTVIKFKPHKKYFQNTSVELDIIKERLIIATACFEDLNIILKVDGKPLQIKGNEESLVNHYLGKNLEWHSFYNEDKKTKESCSIKLSWDLNSKSTKQEIFTAVNFVRVYDGPHVLKIQNIIKDIFLKYAKKNKLEIEPNDILNWFRLYINLRIIDSNFDGQTKTKLSKQTNISIMDSFEKDIENYFKKNEDLVNDLLDRFDIYRKSLHNKKITRTNRKRSSAKFTKLRDCSEDGGELIIGEGESAIGGLVTLRDPKKVAILPLRGVPMNILNHTTNNIVKNEEISDLITAMGCGIEPHCDINKLRFNKILISADADPSGSHITSLLIVLFSKLMPDVVKCGKLFVVETPLFGYKENKKFIPLWTNDEVEIARKNNKHILRIKGLGEFDPVDLKELVLNPKVRKLVKIKWSDSYEQIFNLLSNKGADERKLLALDKWKLE